MKEHSIIALILLSVISLGCAKEIHNQVGNNVTLTTTVSLSGTPASKALTAEGVKTFAAGEQVAIVYTNTAEATVRAVCQPLTVADIHDNGKTATFTVTLTDPKPSGAVRYIYPAAMATADGSVNYNVLSSQNGTLASLSAALDLALFEGSLTADAALPDIVFMNNPLTIGEFTVSDGTRDITSSIVSFTVSAGTDTYTVNRAAAAGPIYVAMKPVSGDFSFTAFNGALVYEKAVTGKTMAAGSMYPVGISMTETFNALATPLTFEAIEAGAKVSFKLPSNTEEGAVQYRVNGGTWTNYNTSKTPITLENVGDKVQFRGNRNTYYVNTSTYDYGQFSASDDCYLYGNIMSLVTDYTTDEHAFASNVTLTGESTFFRLFENNIDNKTTTIRSSDTKPLVLPAMQLADCCYQEMFYNCTDLTAAPALPATQLADGCYMYMFCRCTDLTAAPALPATQLAEGCYYGMFVGCTALTAAPALPATQLTDGCYQNMFVGCTALTAAPALPATQLAEGCYWRMFDGCSALTAAPALPATQLADYCYWGMFGGCSALTAAPALPATQLANQCYQHMFFNCINLCSVTCLATDFMYATDCTFDWLYDVAENGTFYQAAGASWDSGPSGIPFGWDVVTVTP